MTVLTAAEKLARDAEHIRKVGIVNTHQQLTIAVAEGFDKRHALSIALAHMPGRTTYVHGWNVISPFFKTNPDDKGAWFHYGQKWFSDSSGPGDWRKRREAARLEAVEWVRKTYGYAGEWKRNRMGDFVPVEIAKRYPLQKVT